MQQSGAVMADTDALWARSVRRIPCATLTSNGSTLSQPGRVHSTDNERNRGGCAAGRLDTLSVNGLSHAARGRHEPRLAGPR